MSTVRFKWFLLTGVIALCCAWNTNTFANPDTSALSAKNETGVKVAQATIDACANLAAGDACSFTSHKGKTLTGTCVAGEGQNAALACRPEHAPKGPPQVAIDACANHTAGDACSFTTHKGKTLSGTCGTGRGQNESLACRPQFGPPQAAVDACANHAAGDACTFTGHKGKTLSGTCGTGRGQDASLICKPSDWHSGHRR